jgi:hypothetical protein
MDALTESLPAGPNAGFEVEYRLKADEPLRAVLAGCADVRLVLELLGRGGAEPEAHAHRGQQCRVLRLLCRIGEDRPGGGLSQERVQQHRPCLQGREGHRLQACRPRPPPQPAVL